jgi:Domain of unknown function (DUF1877)
MGMIAKFYQVSERQLAQFLRRPSSAYDYTMSWFYDDPAAIEGAEEMLSQLRSKMAGFPPGVLAQLEHVSGLLQQKTSAKKGPQLVTSNPEPETKGRKFSLEKDWHVLHYALNGTHDGGDGPLADAILGGQEIPDVEGVTSFGKGSTGALRYLTVERVHQVAEALKKVDPHQLLSKLNYEDAEQKRIYLSHTLGNLNDWEYLPELFANFRDFYVDASQNSRAMLLSIT